MANTTWREHLTEAMLDRKDEGPVIAWAPAKALFDVPFDDGYGGADGPAVLAWTERYVYFPVQYDGSEYQLRRRGTRRSKVRTTRGGG
jgi:hypothetical protein